MRQILAGNGPVFNPGERVEADTSALWTWLLALLTWATRLDLYTVIIRSGLLLAPLGLLFALLGGRELHRGHWRLDQVLLPVGALVVVALPPFWDFVTLGLEDSLVFCWLGLCWWLLAGLRPDSRRRARWLAFVAGLGWVVRPDMAIGTVGFLAALWYIVRPPGRRLAVLAAIAGSLAHWRTRCSGWATTACECPTRPSRRTLRARASIRDLSTSRISPRRTTCGFRWLVLLLLFLLTARHLQPGRRRPPRRRGRQRPAHGVVCRRDRRRLHARADAAAADVRAAPAGHAGACTGAEGERRGLTQASLLMLAAAIGVWAMGAGQGGETPRHQVPSRKAGIAAERGYWLFSRQSAVPGQRGGVRAGGHGLRNAALAAWSGRSAGHARSGQAGAVLLPPGGSSYVSVPLSGPGYSVAVEFYHFGHWGRGHAAGRTCRGP